MFVLMLYDGGCVEFVEFVELVFWGCLRWLIYMPADGPKLILFFHCCLSSVSGMTKPLYDEQTVL